jgi:CTP:molybdopterin cytidylyltransferase MocA/HD superfamily phosphohydrolase YqeK
MMTHIGTINGSKFAALIPAAGYSSRMGVFKSLMPLGRSLVIERAISTFKEAGVEDIRVVTGYKEALLVPVLNRLCVKVIKNPDFDKGMYSSIKAGVRTLDDTIDSFFLLPGDCPLVGPGTIHALMRAYRRNPTFVIYPVHEGSQGHPPLISIHLRSLIENHNPENGLKDLLEHNVPIFQKIPVEDPNIHVDLDTIQDCESYCGDEYMHFPSEKECLKLLQSAGVERNIVLHSTEVARIAVSISEHLNSQGGLINLGHVMAAGLLHDIAKGTFNHAQRGREIVSKLGYEAVADIIETHMDLPYHLLTTINEAGIVYLSDKMVNGNSIADLEGKFHHALSKYGKDSAIRENIKRRFEYACEIKRNIEIALNSRIEDILSKGSLDSVPCKEE